jgi:hypothetical protein
MTVLKFLPNLSVVSVPLFPWDKSKSHQATSRLGLGDGSVRKRADGVSDYYCRKPGGSML